MSKRRYSLTLEDNEAEIVLAYASAKGKKSLTALFDDAVEHLMARSKVKDLHERLLECRIGNGKKRQGATARAMDGKSCGNGGVN